MDEVETSDQIAEWLVAKAKRDPKVAEIIERAHLFDDLRTHPAWVRLLEYAEREKDRFLASLVRRLWETPHKPPSPGEIEYHKGFYQGSLWVLKHPEMAEASLAQAARAAWLMAQDELQEAEEEIG